MTSLRKKTFTDSSKEKFSVEWEEFKSQGNNKILSPVHLRKNSTNERRLLNGNKLEFKKKK